MIKTVLHPSQALLDRLVCDFELLGADAAVVVFEPDAVVAPYQRGAACAAACGDAWAAFA